MHTRRGLSSRTRRSLCQRPSIRWCPMATHTLVLLSLALVVGAQTVLNPATITNVDVLTGSLLGQTQITISGAGFARNGVQVLACVHGIETRAPHNRFIFYHRAPQPCTSARTCASRSSTSRTTTRSCASRRPTQPAGSTRRSSECNIYASFIFCGRACSVYIHFANSIFWPLVRRRGCGLD